jgi:malate dehydrogenase (oxaloacetate-decarboxylating)(NADP+)
LLGTEAVIRARIAVLHVHASSVRIIDPAAAPERARYAEELYRLRQRKGVTQREAEEMALNRTTFGALMLRAGEADALIGGLTQHYPDTIRPALQVIAVRPDLRKVSGVYVLITPRGDIYFLADATVNIEASLRKTWPRLPFAPPKRCGASGKNRV